jgi:hypothetical protein
MSIRAQGCNGMLVARYNEPLSLLQRLHTFVVTKRKHVSRPLAYLSQSLFAPLFFLLLLFRPGLSNSNTRKGSTNRHKAHGSAGHLRSLQSGGVIEHMLESRVSSSKQSHDFLLSGPGKALEWANSIKCSEMRTFTTTACHVTTMKIQIARLHHATQNWCRDIVLK